MIFFTPLQSNPPLAGPSKYCHNVRFEKLQWCSYQMLIKFEKNLAVSTKYRHVTERRTDRHLATLIQSLVP